MRNDYRIFQRTGSTTDVPFRVMLRDPSVTQVEARWRGGSWQDVTLVNGVADVVFAAQTAGQGLAEIRNKSTGAALASIANLGLGDVFALAGQSNSFGVDGATLQSYSHASLKAGCFYRDNEWGELIDPISKGPPRDAVLGTNAAGGNVFTKVVTSIMADQGVPVGLIPCGKGSTAIAAWAPGADHQDRTTLYGEMVYRCLQAMRSTGGIKAVLWWQGESDAVAGTTKATYKAALEALGDAVFADLGCSLIACKLLNCANLTAPEQAPIDDAIGECWGTHHILAGPDLGGIASDDAAGFHATTQPTIDSVAALWWTAIEAALYP